MAVETKGNRAAQENISNNREGFGRQQTRTWQRMIVNILQRTSGSLQRMPREKALRWGERIGSVAWRAAKRQRRYAHRNLRIAEFPVPESTLAERDALVRRVFINFAKTAIDFLRSPAVSSEHFVAMIKEEGWDHVETALAAGHGAILMTAHLGNWEMLGQYVASRGAKLTVIAREPEDPVFGDFIRNLRRSGGYEVKDKGNAARDILSVLKKGDAVGILPDQNSGDLFTPFFGLPAGTVAGPALFALRTGAPIIPSYMIRLPDNTYIARFLPPLTVESTGDRNADVQRIMSEANQTLEGIIRLYPDQWLWLHNRWKSSFEKKNLLRAWPEGENTPHYKEALSRWNNNVSNPGK